MMFRSSGIAVEYLGLSLCYLQGVSSVSELEEKYKNQEEDKSSNGPVVIALHFEDALNPTLPIPPLILPYEGFKILMQDLRENEEFIAKCCLTQNIPQETKEEKEETQS